VTNGEFIEFIQAGGYRCDRRPVAAKHWLSDGWAAVSTRGWQAPLHWQKHNGRLWHFTLAGLCEIDDAQPVCHVSYYEPDARWQFMGIRLARDV